MKKLFPFDQLTFFLLLSGGLMWLIYGNSLFGIELKHNRLTKYVTPENYFEYTSIGATSDAPVVSLIRPEMTLEVSIDGGDKFYSFDNEMSLDDLKKFPVDKQPISFHWKHPFHNLPEGYSAIVRAKHKSQNIKTEEVVLNWYQKDQHNLPIMMITVKQSDLIGYKNGIMAFGEDASFDNGFYKNWWNRNANFQDRGYSSERTAYFSYFENDQLQYESKCGIRINGNATRGFPQKSLRLTTGKNYGSEFFDFRFFGKEGLKKYQSLILRNSGNDNTHTLFADLLMHRLAEGSNVTAQAGEPMVVYINGFYWGVYNLRERIDTYYLSKIEDVKEDEITLLEGSNAALKDGSKKEQKEFSNLIQRIEDADYSKEISNELQEKIDLNSFYDYILFQAYYGNNDWPHNNIILYKAEGKKWKWILHDLDISLAYPGDQNLEYNVFEKLQNSGSVCGKIYRYVLKDSILKQNFISRGIQITETFLSEENIQKNVDQLKNSLDSEIENQIGRWRMIDSKKEWEESVEKNKTFLIERKEQFKNQLEEL